MRVLIVDQDESYLAAARTYLWVYGYEVEIATDGLTCMSQLHDYLPDVLLLGSKILWGGSEGVLEMMNQDILWSKIPVILINTTSCEMNELSHRMICGSIHKPLRINEMIRQIKAATEGQYGIFNRMVSMVAFAP